MRKFTIFLAVIFASSAEANQNYTTLCTIKNFVCIDQIYYGRTQPTKITENENCLWHVDEISFDFENGKVKHLPNERVDASGMLLENGASGVFDIYSIAEGAMALITVKYKNEYWNSVASLNYDKAGETIISFTATHMSNDGYPSVSIGNCSTVHSYSDLLNKM